MRKQTPSQQEEKLERTNTQQTQNSKKSIRPTPTPKSQQQAKNAQQFNQTGGASSRHSRQSQSKSGLGQDGQLKKVGSRESDQFGMSGGFDKLKEKDQQIQEGRIEEYEDDDENLICARFPHLDFCACEVDCTISIRESQIYEMIPGLYIGDFVCGISTRKLLQYGISHILNVTATEYKKRKKYFKYLTIDAYDKSDEDIKKHFRISNRFIQDCISQGGKVLIQDLNRKSIGPSFALAYLINNEKIPLKQGYELIRQLSPGMEITPNFTKQLERYDLEKLALVTLKKKDTNAAE